MSDTWRFDGTHWAYWNAGTNTPVSGALREFSPSYSPGRRGNLAASPAGFVVGGEVYTGLVVDGYSDIWKFESDKGWALWDGFVTSKNNNPGTIKVPSATNIFGGRKQHMVVADKEDRIWIFGGNGRSTVDTGKIV
jgi:hypothetical protein